MRILASILLLGMVAVATADDEVKLKNGDRVTGKITGLAGGKLTIETAHSGPLNIDWAQVVSIKTDAPIKLKLSSGEWLDGKVSPGAEGKIKVESAGAAAPVEVEYPKVASINEPPASWHGKISAAAKATDGNTHNRSFLIAAEATRDTEQDTIVGRAIFRYGETSGVLTERNAYGIAKYMYKFSPAWYGYVSEELLGDTFKDLNLNTVTSAGAGYVAVKEAWIDLAFEAGIAYITNDFDVAGDESHIGARAQAYLRLALPMGFELKDRFIIYPNFEDSQDFQIRNEATLGTALGSGWDLLGGIITEYDRTPSAGLKRRDDTFFVGLGYTF